MVARTGGVILVTQNTMPTENNWLVYIILTRGQRLYTGITNNLERRWQSHLDGKGAKFFRTDPPQHIVYLENGHDRSSASQRENAIKQLSRDEKLKLITTNNPTLAPIDSNLTSYTH